MRTKPKKFSTALLLTLLLCAPLPVFAKKPAKPKVDKILVEKADRRMTLFQGEKVVKVYKVSLGSEPVGPKQFQGDHKTPEGKYTIDARNANSHYHRALHVSYPSARDRQRASRLGLSAGGSIMIHGLPNGMPDLGPLQRAYDWTDGCIAVGNAEIDEIWGLVPTGTPIEIRP